jgi:L-ascorbate metabolism protein UlaG (beta-lactamase superfamily)
MSFAKRRISELLLALALGNPAMADVSLTQLANEGVLIDDGETRVMIDGMVVEPYSIYAGLPPRAAADFDAVTGLFAGIDLVLASHRHHDHNQPAFACDFMQRSEESALYTSSEVIGLMREKCRDFVTGSARVVMIDPQPGQPVVIEHGSARVTAYRLSHGKRKYAKIENLAHHVELGGVSILHIGDGAMDLAEFERAGLGGMEADVAIIPVWFFQPGPGAAVVEAYLDAPLKLAAQVPPDEVDEARRFLAEHYPRVRLLEPLERLRVAPRVQPGASQ